MWRAARRTRVPYIAAASILPIAVVAISPGISKSAPQRDAVVTFAHKSKDPTDEVKHDVSPPLRSIPPAEIPKKPKKVHEHDLLPVAPATGAPDPVIQSTPGLAAAPTAGVNFEGVGQGFSGPSGTYTVDSAPPDTNGAVGPNQYVEIVNTAFAIFNKSGTPVYGPVASNTLWSGFGGGCQTNNDGDAVVEYDSLANRWFITQFSVSTTPYLECVAVSTSGDPTGSYYRYAFQYNDFPDYPKVGVWPDGYYISFNMFRGNSFLGAKVCAYDRTKMLVGQAATQQCFDTGSAYGGLLTSDVDGATAPPSGARNYALAFGANSLLLWRFHADWATPANSTFTGPTSIPVAAFSAACTGGGTCIQQAGTTQRLDSLADRLMFRLQYRNFGDHEALVANHSVTAGSSVGVRWYELRNPAGTPTVFQQGTYAPDSSYRWMGSAAMDGAGNIALGYSVSSSSLNPGIRYTGRLASDPAGTMTQGEGTLRNGGGSQTGGLSRWGDYSDLNVDPSDDCTFWYADEYLASSGSFNWHTRIGSFSLPGCTSGPSDFSISANPTSLGIAQGGSGTSTISTAITSGSAQTVNLSATGQPAGTTVTFNPTSVTAGGSSTMTVDVGAATAPGTYPITVTGTGSSATHTTSVSLTVTQAPVSDFSISANPTSRTVVQGGSGTSTISTAVTSGSAQTVSLSATGQPAGTTVTFNPTSVTAGGSSTMTMNVGAATATGTYTITVTGTGSSATHTTSVALTVTQAPSADFSISANPTSLSVTQGGSGTSTISTAVTSGSAQTVSLSATGQPAGTTVSFTPTSVTAGGSSTMTVNVGSGTATGGYTITVTGTGSSATHSTSVGLTVTTAGAVVNGGFETGNLTGWSASGLVLPIATTPGHTGSYSARIGSPSPFNGNSILSQTVGIPSGNSRLTFWYRPSCPDTITYDQIQMQIRSTSGATLATVLNVCSNSGVWQQVTFDTSAYAGQGVVLWFNVHDDGYPTDPTYALIDDVAISSYTPTPNVVQNPGFETGSLSSWSPSGLVLPVIAAAPHSGSYSARIGSPSPYNGNSILAQTVTVPAGASTLSFWYRPFCPDTITYDQIQMQIRSTAGATLATVLNTCTNSGAWSQVNYNSSSFAGQTVVLWFNVHDDGYPSDPTYAYIDDVSLKAN